MIYLAMRVLDGKENNLMAYEHCVLLFFSQVIIQKFTLAEALRACELDHIITPQLLCKEDQENHHRCCERDGQQQVGNDN